MTPRPGANELVVLASGWPRDGEALPIRADALDLHGQHSVAIHFGLIDNAGESYEAPVMDLTVARKANGVDEATFVTPRLGQVFQY